MNVSGGDMSRVGQYAGRAGAVAAAACIVAVALLPLARGADERTLTVGVLSEPVTLNPLAATSSETKDIIWRIFLKLLDEKPDYLNFEPRLARSWSFSADSLTITFHLRDDVRWTDGTPVTAEDVRFTWQLQADTAIAWRSRSLKQHIRDVEVVDRHTVAFHFSRRYPYQLMDANDGVILPRHLLKDIPRDRLREHSFGRSPVGCGPYRLRRWEPEQYIELVKNDDYYEKGKPHVERVIFKFVPDMVTLITQLKKGEIDLLESIPGDQLPDLAQNYPRLRVYSYLSREYWYIAWNLRESPFSDARVRTALTMAIDRREIIRTLWGGQATVCTSPIHPALWAFDATIEEIPYDSDGARRALEDLGWRDRDGDGVLDKDGRPFEFELITNGSSQQRVDVATMVEAYLDKIGVRANIRTMEFRTVVDRLFAFDYDGCLLGWATATKPDITTHWHSSAIPPNGYNISGYQNPEVDRLIDEAKVELDRERARALWSRVQRVIYRDQPFTFLLIPYEVTALDGRFCGVEPNAISFFYNLRDWRVGADCE
jgi:peptide/nickel transport system substrate-binding protein